MIQRCEFDVISLKTLFYLKIFFNRIFELRSNIVSGSYYYIVPFFRFESAKNTDHKVAVSIISKVTGPNFKSESMTPNKDFPAASLCPTFMYQHDYASYCENGTLTLLIEVRTEYMFPSSDLGKNLLEQKGKIVKDLNAFIGEKNTSDFTYRVDDQDFYVHKMMLSGKKKNHVRLETPSELSFLTARSPVFFKMFATDYKTSDKGIMNDISKDAFKEFLRFIYTGGVEKLKQHALELLKIADKYEVDDLKSICELHLMTNLTESDAVDLFTCAHKYRCNADLKKASFEFIKK